MDIENSILEYLVAKNAMISYAMLKAIVDNIRIREFWLLQEGKENPKIGYEDIIEVIDNVLSNSNRGKDVKDTEESIL